MIVIICPSEFEHSKLHPLLDEFKDAVLVKSGMGKVRSAVACSKAIIEYGSVDFILLAGYAGGLSQLAVGDVIEPHLFIEQDYCAEPLEPFPNKIQKSVGCKLSPDSIEAVMLTQDRFLTENPYKEGPYAAEYGQLACDMESYAVAAFAESHKIPYSCIKLISDAADENADHDFLAACERLAPKLRDVIHDALEQVRTGKA